MPAMEWSRLLVAPGITVSVMEASPLAWTPFVRKALISSLHSFSALGLAQEMKVPLPADLSWVTFASALSETSGIWDRASYTGVRLGALIG